MNTILVVIWFSIFVSAMSFLFAGIRYNDVTFHRIGVGLLVIAFFPLVLLMLPALVIIAIARYKHHLKNYKPISIVARTIRGDYGNGFRRRLSLIVVVGSKANADYIQEQVNLNMFNGTTYFSGENRIRIYEEESQ